MRKLTIPFIFMPAIAFAAAGSVDSYYNHRCWIFPAYAYCLVFGLVILLGMSFASFFWKLKVQKLTEQISQYLIEHRVTAIVLTGILLAIPIGIIGAVLWETMPSSSIFPFMGMMIIFPIILVNKHFREKILLSTFWVKYSLMIAISSIAASLIFIILTNCEMLPGTNITYIARLGRTRGGNCFPTHPYDSIKDIWDETLSFIVEIPLSLMLFWIGGLRRYICNKISLVDTNGNI